MIKRNLARMLRNPGPAVAVLFIILILTAIPNRLGWVPDAVVIGIGFIPLTIVVAALHLGLKETPKSLDK